MLQSLRLTRVSGSQYLVSTSVVIHDVNDVAIEGARVLVKVNFPDGNVLVFPLATGQSGEAILSFRTKDTGLYRFTAKEVNVVGRVYDASLNIETNDTLLIPEEGL